MTRNLAFRCQMIDTLPVQQGNDLPMWLVSSWGSVELGEQLGDCTVQPRQLGGDSSKFGSSLRWRNEEVSEGINAPLLRLVQGPPDCVTVVDTICPSEERKPVGERWPRWEVARLEVGVVAERHVLPTQTRRTRRSDRSGGWCPSR
jgi:hypothetical protein